MSPGRPDVIVILTDQERAAPPYETDDMHRWRGAALPGRRWFDEHGVSFDRHYTGSLACVPSRPTIFTGQFPDVHGVTQTDGLGKDADDSGMRWMRHGEVPTLGHWFRAAGYDARYEGKWHISHVDLTDPSTGEPLATNDDAGVVDPIATQAYLDADRLDPFGFSGWVGPEPHGGKLSNSGLRRDGLYADRAVAWLNDRYERRRSGDTTALRPFLLVVSFVNPHDIVLFPGWTRKSPISLSDDPYGTPDVPQPPTADDDLADKPAAHAAYRDSYPTGYAPIGDGVYDERGDDYRRLYYRLHADVDAPLDRVRRMVTEGGSENAVLIRTADHGELLGAHGGLHQKWFTLYDEAVRVPFTIVRIGDRATSARTIDDMVSSHVDIVPTLLAAARIDTELIGSQLEPRFSEFHPLPGHDLMPVVDGGPAERERTIYLMTRDNIMEGDTGASAVARGFGLAADPPDDMLIEVPANVGANFEAIVTTLGGRFWKLVRTFDDPNTWTEPGVRQLATSGPGGPTHRAEVLPDEWELYDLTDDPIERHNRWNDPDAAALRAKLVQRLNDQRRRDVPIRNVTWRYSARLSR